MTSLAELGSTSFVLLDAAEPPDPGTAEYGVLIEQGSPVSIVAAGSPGRLPLVVLDGDQSMADFLDSEAVTLLDLGSPVALLMRGDTVTGVLPVSLVAAALAQGEYQVESETMGPHGGTGDGQLPGRPRAGYAIVHCARCGWENRLAFYDPLRPPQCANPDSAAHPLEVR